MINVKVGDVLVCKRLSSIYYQKYTNIGNYVVFPSTIGEKVIIEEIIVDSYPFVVISNNIGKFNFPIDTLYTYFDTLQDHRRKMIEDLI